ncbi:MAG: flagellar motor protein MotB [Ruminococcaceae bacterium]|nr:flagellar motor protein MotB [Oscillospiraceae bacterium]
MAKKSKPEGKKYSYMDTYGDLVTLLMCFFVLLFAMSTIEETKYNAFVEALSDRYGTFETNRQAVDTSNPVGSDQGEDPPTGEVIDPEPSQPADFTELQAAITEFVEENNLEGEVTIEVGESGAIFLRLSNNLLFAGDSAVLQEQSYVFLNFLGECFLPLENDIFQIQYLGHTADIPGSGTDDWLLSAERAGQVASYFGKQVGFSEYKQRTNGFGRLYPIGDNETAEGRAANRRVDLVIIANDDKISDALTEAAKVYFPDDDTEYFQGTPEELPANALDKQDPNATPTLDLTGLSEEDRADFVEALNDMGVLSTSAPAG